MACKLDNYMTLILQDRNMTNKVCEETTFSKYKIKLGLKKRNKTESKINKTITKKNGNYNII